MVHLAVDDARTAREAGVRFARVLAGATSTAFMLALVEQEGMIQRAIIEAGLTTEQARFATEHFEVAARLEWARITGVGRTTQGGQA